MRMCLIDVTYKTYYKKLESDIKIYLSRELNGNHSTDVLISVPFYFISRDKEVLEILNN